MLLLVIVGNCRTRASYPFGLRIVIERLGIYERLQDCLRVIVQLNACGIRDGQIKDFTSFSLQLLLCLREAIRRQFPISAMGKHTPLSYREACLPKINAGAMSRSVCSVRSHGLGKRSVRAVVPLPPSGGVVPKILP